MGMSIIEAQRVMSGATMPWSNSHGYKEPTYIGVDGKKEIMKCLACTKEICDDCVCKKSREEKMNDKQSLIEKLSGQDLTVKEICAIMNISRRTYYYYKERIEKNESE